MLVNAMTRTTLYSDMGFAEIYSVHTGTSKLAMKRLLVTPDGKTYLIASDDGIQIFRTYDGSLLTVLKNGNTWDYPTIGIMALTSDGTLLAAGLEDGTIQIWKMNW